LGKYDGATLDLKVLNMLSLKQKIRVVFSGVFVASACIVQFAVVQSAVAQSVPQPSIQPSAQAVTSNQSRYTQIPASPDGIGKRYMGREIAGIMGWQGASWLEREEREKEERTDLLIKELDVKPGMTVADIGAGTGYFSRRIAPLLGSAGRVFAVDVQPQMVTLLERLAAKDKITNITAVLGESAQVKLADASIDLAIMVDVYHELEYPYEMMQSIVKALKPGGRLVFVEYRAEDSFVPIKEIHKMTEAQVRTEAAVHALTWERTSKRLPWQHVIIFKKS
jgi:precorrin-6B methylase 2